MERERRGVLSAVEEARDVVETFALGSASSSTSEDVGGDKVDLLLLLNNSDDFLVKSEGAEGAGEGSTITSRSGMRGVSQGSLRGWVCLRWLLHDCVHTAQRPVWFWEQKD